jgi:hypothetical protein
MMDVRVCEAVLARRRVYLHCLIVLHNVVAAPVLERTRTLSQSPAPPTPRATTPSR